MKAIHRFRVAALLAAAWLGGCAVVDTTGAAKADPAVRWALLPFANFTETPYAGNRAESITQALLASRGVHDLQQYPPKLAQETLFEPGQQRLQEQALSWAKGTGARFAVAGAVEEWRYKVGVDGEPAVGVTLQIVDLTENKVVWSGVGGKSGWSRESLAAVGQKLIREMLDQALPAASR
jgi:TolB-like protein